MKTTKWIIIIALLCFKTISYSQNFINDNKEWAVYTHLFDSPTFYTTNYKFLGDSNINGNIYHVLYHSSDSMQLNWTIDSYWWERNDSVFKRCQGCGGLALNDSTILLYDFNIHEGDTFHIGLYDGMRVDSIRYFVWGGNIRKHWFFSLLGDSGYVISHWVQGVGQMGVFVNSVDFPSSSTSLLLCFHENGSLVYQNPNFTSCYYVYTDAPSIIQSNEHINLFPNPASTMLSFTIPENANSASYTLYNSQGVVQLAGIANKAQTELNTASLQRGLYFLKIKTNKKTIIKKIILQ